MSAQQDYLDAQKQVENTKKDALQKAQKWFDEGSKSIFEKNPLLSVFSWPQYTPYFNDGDPCTFRACTYSIRINGGASEDDEDEEENVNGALDETTRKNLVKEISDFLKQFNKEDLEEMFGEGEVEVYPNSKVVIQEYDHD